MANQVYVVTPVSTSIAPNQGSPKPPTPTNASADYYTSLSKLAILMTFKIPSSIDPTEVTIQQYFNSGDTSKLEFYAVYDKTGSGDLVSVNAEFNASNVDASSNSINLSLITSVKLILVCGVGPKSSKGCTKTVTIKY